MSTAANPQLHQGLTLLEPVLTPGYFSHNPFRVLEVPIDTNPRDWERRLKAVLLAEQNKMSVPPGRGRCLPLDPPPDSLQVREARHALDDPQTALVARLFWFWPLTPDDAGIRALAAGDTATAIEAWSETERDGGFKESMAARHNLAVLYLLSAASMTESDEERDHAMAPEVWQQAFAAWSGLLSGTDISFRTLAEERLVAGDCDPRLAGVCEALAAALPQALAEMPLRCLLAAIPAASHEWLIQVSKQSGMNHPAAAAAMAQRIADKIAAARTAAVKASEAQPVHADHSCRSFWKMAQPLLPALDQLLPQQDTLRIKMHDEVATGVLSCQIDFANATDDWETSLLLLQSVENIAASPETRQRINDNIAKVREIAEETNRWRAPGYAALPANVRAAMDEARALLDRDNEEAAIRAVATVYTSYQGKPEGIIFETAIAYALNRRALCLDKAAFRVFNEDPPTLARFKRGAAGDIFSSLASSLGLSDIPSGMLHCHACGGPIYSQYYNVTIGGVKGIQCVSCNLAIDREIEEQKRVLANALAEPTADIMLARELNPKSIVLRKNWELFSAQAAKYSVKFPSSTLPRRIRLGIATLEDLTKEILSKSALGPEVWATVVNRRDTAAKEFCARYTDAASGFVRAALAGDPQTATACANTLNELPEAVGDSLLHLAAPPLLEWMRTLAQEARIAANPGNDSPHPNLTAGGEEAAFPAVQAIASLQTSVKPVFAMLAGLLSYDLDAECRHIVWEAILDIAWKHGKHTDRWAECVELLKTDLPNPTGWERLLQAKDQFAANAQETNWWRGHHYFSVPPSLREQLEAACVKAQEKKWDEAAQAVADIMLGKTGIALSENARKTAEQALAYALHGSACAALKIASEENANPASQQAAAATADTALQTHAFTSYGTCSKCGASKGAVEEFKWTCKSSATLASKALPPPQPAIVATESTESLLRFLDRALLALELNPKSVQIAETAARLRDGIVKRGRPPHTTGVIARIELGLATVEDLVKAARDSDKRAAAAAWKALEIQSPDTATKLRKTIATRRRIVAGTVAALAVAMVACVAYALKPETRERNAWNQVTGRETPEAVRQFLVEWPSGAHAREAAQWLATDDEAAWQRALQAASFDAVKQYLALYPNGAHAASAQADSAAWENATWITHANVHTTKALSAFIRDHPSCAFLAEAKKALEKKLAPWAGAWRDEEDKIVHTVEITGGQPRVVSAVKDSGESLPVDDLSWNNETLTWSYTRKDDDGKPGKVFLNATAVKGNEMKCTWKGEGSGTCSLKKTPQKTTR